MKQTHLYYVKTLLLLLMVAFMVSYALYYVSLEHKIYFWDFSLYWRSWEILSSRIAHQPLQAIGSVFNSVNKYDYNFAPIFFPTIFHLLPLPSRASYILSIVVFYFIPVICLFSYIFCQYVAKTSKTMSCWLLSICLPATYVAFWGPTLAGYPDIAGLVFVLLALLYQFNLDIGQKLYVKKMLVLGAILWAPFLLRRWYAYTVVSLYISLPILNYFLFYDKRNIFIRFKLILTNFFIAGLASCVLAVTFQHTLLKRIMITNYADLYSAYQAGMATSIRNTSHECGLYLLPLIIIALVLCLFKIRKKQCLFVIFCFFNLIFTFYIFSRTQTPGQQHVLPFALWILFIVCYVLQWINDQISKRAITSIFITIVIVCLGYINIKSVYDRSDYTESQNAILPNKHLPLRVENYSTYLRLVNDVKQLVGNHKQIAILSSNQTLNDAMFDTLSDQKLSNNIAWGPQVDSRDKLQTNTLMAEYVLVVDPPQTHLGDQNQRVITVPVNDLLHNVSIGQAYKRVGDTYKLNDNATAIIYEKQRNFTPNEVADFLQQFYAYHPEWKAIYDNNGLFKSFLTAHVIRGDIYGGATLDNGSLNRISTHPGSTTPTIIKWTLQNVPKLKISSYNMSCNQKDPIKISISSDGIPTKDFEVPHGKDIIIDMMPWQNIVSSMKIEKNKSSGCDSLAIYSAEDKD